MADLEKRPKRSEKGKVLKRQGRTKKPEDTVQREVFTFESPKILSGLVLQHFMQGLPWSMA